MWVDANHDGKSWDDNNHNGIRDADGHSELKSLDELGITQIDLLPRAAAPGTMLNNNRVLHYGSFVMNGATREALGVNFIADSSHHQFSTQGGQFIVSMNSSYARIIVVEILSQFVLFIVPASTVNLKKIEAKAVRF